MRDEASSVGARRPGRGSRTAHRVRATLGSSSDPAGSGIDASNARDLRQVAYYYVNGTDPETNPSSNSWDTAWRGNLIYLFDMDRGIEILRLKGGPHAAAKLATVREPKARVDKLAKVPVSGLTRGSLVCPLFVAQPQ